MSFTVGGSASYENQGVLNTERINIDYTRRTFVKVYDTVKT